MITLPKEEDLKGKEIEGISTVVGQNLKGESKLVILKDRPVETPGLSVDQNWTRTIQSKEELLWKENHPGKKLFITVCNLCTARHLLDFNVEDKHFECTCEVGPPNKEHPKYYICNAQHAHFDIKKAFNKTQQDCKICLKILNTPTKLELKVQQQVREEEAVERRANEKLRKGVEEEEKRATHKQKEHEAELYASALAGKLTPLFEDLKNEIRNDRKEK